MGNVVTDPTSAAVHIGVGKVNAVAGDSYLITAFGQRLYRQTKYLIQTRFAAESACIACERYAKSFGGVDSAALSSRYAFDKSFRICICERQYFLSSSNTCIAYFMYYFIAVI